MLYALPGRLADSASDRSKRSARKASSARRASTTTDLDGIEPFGFVDGISQPLLDWERKRPARDGERADYSNLSCLGEYLLGYPNEYGGYTDRPLLDAARAGARLPRAEDAPDRADLGRNGSYLVLRQLRQDVHGFWHFVDRRPAATPRCASRWRERDGRTQARRRSAGRPH